MDKTKNRHPRDRAYLFFGEFGLFNFTIFRPSIIFSEPGSSDLLRFAHQSFLANPVNPIYYGSHINHFSEPGSSDLLRCTPHAFLSKSAHLIYCVFRGSPPALVSPSCFTTFYLEVWGLGGTRRGFVAGGASGAWLKTASVFTHPPLVSSLSAEKNGRPREMTYRFFGEFVLFDFSMFYPIDHS